MSKTQPESKDKGARLRRTLYALMLVGLVALCGPMIASAIAGIRSGEVYDPFTGGQVKTDDHIRRDCVIEGGRLLDEVDKKAINLEEFDSRMEGLGECRTLYPRLHAALKGARRSLAP